MKRVLQLLLMLAPAFIYAQETTGDVTKPAKEVVKSTFENSVLLNSQTVDNAAKKSLDFMIMHRFGLIENAKDLFGFYASANIRLGLNYGITDRIAVGLGVTKYNMTYDLQWRYMLLKQAKSGGSPVTVTYFGNACRSAADENQFKNQDGVYNSNDRFSWFHELMIARKFSRKFSLQVAGEFGHFNIVDSLYEHDNIGISFLGRYKFSPQSSVIVDFDYLLTKQGLSDLDPKPNLGIGFEVSTGNHQFEIFVCNGGQLLKQDMLVYNQNDFFKGEVMFGFNITRQWGF